MSLLFQRQDEDMIVQWQGRAGHYLNDDLNALAQRFPTRAPTTEDDRQLREPSQGTGPIKADQWIARGLCPRCQSPIVDDTLRCKGCHQSHKFHSRVRRAKVTLAIERAG